MKRTKSEKEPKILVSKHVLPKSTDKKPKQRMSQQTKLAPILRGGVQESYQYSDLGFDKNLAKDYELGWSESKYTEWLNTRGERFSEMLRDKYRRKIPYPELFSLVLEHLMEVCKTSIPKGQCQVNPLYPGIEWHNHSPKIAEAKEAWERKMYLSANHYFHEYNKVENPKIWGKDDIHYCLCKERKGTSNAYETLTLNPEGDDEEWQNIHGTISIDGEKITREVTLALRKKILKDSLEYVASEYKIHLQPKPEYQIAVIREIINLLKNDADFLSKVDTWKALVPYSYAIDEIHLPAIVIYPVWGKEIAEYVFRKIVDHFSEYDSAEIGMNITPRLNAQYNELIYIANGAGDKKYDVPDKYFERIGDKSFFKGGTFGRF